jgi:hypothetical protein
MRRVVLITVGLVAIAACGEEKLTAQEFVQQANQKGASIELGEELPTDREDTEIYGVTVEPLGKGESRGHEHGGGGSLAVLADADRGAEEVARCRSAVDLICFQAGNVVLLVGSEVSQAEVGRLSRAIRAMAE